MLEASIRGRVETLELEAHLDAAGGPLVLVGPNGAGKTTLLLMILGVRRPDAGRVVVGGVTLYDSSRAVDLAVEDRGLGYVPQDYALFSHLTVLQNVEFALGARKHRDPRVRRRAQARAMLDEVGLLHLERRTPRELSGGERQKLALARALAARPRALLLDEPLAALDAAARRDVRAFLASHLCRAGVPALLVTHDPTDALALGHRIAVLERGHIVQTGTWNDLCERPATEFVEKFVAPELIEKSR